MKTPTRTAAEFRRMYSTAEWDARIEPDGSVWLTIPGRPVPKGRPRLGVRGRKAYVYTPPKTKEYEKLVGWVWRCAGCKPLNGPIAVKLRLFIRGRSGDVDNYSKSILDGLNGVAYEDDDQVVELQVRKYKVKRKEEERAEIEIREFKEAG